MVMSEITASSSTISGMRARGTAYAAAETAVEIFLRRCSGQFFSRDMHPGQDLRAIDDPQSPALAEVDFGIVARAGRDQHYLAGNLMAFFGTGTMPGRGMPGLGLGRGEAGR